jgi:hypothetical protein
MDRGKSLVRRNLVFGAAACVGLLVVVLRPTPGVAVQTTFPKVFPGFEPVKARAIEITRKAKKDGQDVVESMRLEQNATDSWVVQTTANYPVRLATVKRFLDAVASAEEKNEPTSNPEKFPTFAGSEGFTEVRVSGEAGLLVSFGLGRGNAEGSWSDHYLRVDDVKLGVAAPSEAGKPPKARIVVAHAGDLGDVKPEVSSWVETRLFPSLVEGDVQAVAVEQKTKDVTLAFVRGAKGEKDAEDPWTMTKPESGKAVPDRIHNLVATVVGLSLSKVVGALKPGDEAKYGFDKPEIVVTASGRPAPKPTDAPPTWGVIVGKKSDVKDLEGWFVRRAVNGVVEGYVLLVADYALGELRSEPSSYLEKKPEPPAPTPPAPAMDGEPAMGAEPAMQPEPGTPTPPAMEGAPPAPSPAPPPPPETPPPPPPAMDEGMR